MPELTDDPIATPIPVDGKERDFSWLARWVVLDRTNKALGLPSRAFSIRRRSGYWFVFNGKVFQRYETEEMAALVRPLLDRCTYQKLGKTGSYSTVRLEPTMGTMTEVLGALALLPGVRATQEPDQNPDELVCANGRLDLATGRLGPHSPDVFSTRILTVEWPEPSDALAAARKRWDAHLASLRLSPETLAYVHRALGYACTGRGNEKAFFFHHGVKDTGKSTLIYLAMNVLGRMAEGGYAALTTTTEWLEQRGGANGHTDGLMGIEGARLVFGDEMPEVARFNSARLKATCSGMSSATLRLSAKGEKGRDVPVRWALFFASNWLPATQDKATQDRMKLIVHENVVENPDPNFERKFMTPIMRQVVLMWLVEGAQAYIAHGLGLEPASVQANRAAYVEDNDPIGPFLQDKVRRLSDHMATRMAGVKNSELHSAYVEWCKEHGIKAVFSIRAFKKLVEDRLGIQAYTLNGAQAFKGYCLSYQSASPGDADDLDIG